jgi:DNA-binding LytR/AlgR family response regulator
MKPLEKKRLSVLIVEDDPSFGLELEMLVEEIGCKVVGLVDNAAAALELIFSEEIDLILMDIDIKGKLNGLAIGKKIYHLSIPVLFITGMSTKEHYEEALTTNFIGYLVKPVNKYTLKTTIDLAFDKLRQGSPVRDASERKELLKEDFFFVRRNKLHEKVNWRDIALIEGASDYVKLWTKDSRSYLLRQTMKRMEEMLGKRSFYRVHRSYIVNLEAIEAIDFKGGEIRVLNREVPINRKSRQELEQMALKVE